MSVDKLVDSSQLDTDLTSVANAIRAKSGGSGSLAFPAGFVSEIGNIPTGGSGEWTTDGIAANADPNGAITIMGTSISAYAFAGKAAITSVSCPNVTGLGNYAFMNCTGITSLTLPKMTWNGQHPFNGMTGLKSLSCPAMTRNYAKFLGSASLEEVYFPNLTSIETDQFLEGTRIQFLVFPSFSGRVYSSSLRNNSLLEGVDLAACTGFVNGTNFSGCSVLNKLVIRGANVPTLGNINAFTNTPFASGKSGGTLYVPQDMISSYQAATNWSTILGYANNQIKSIESTATDPDAPVDLTTHYIDGTPIPTT